MGCPYSEDEDGHFLKDVGNQSMEGLHPVTLEQKVPVDVEIAAVIAVNLDAESLHHSGLVEPCADPIELLVAEGMVATLGTDIIRVLA